jgi:hypothetical protein
MPRLLKIPADFFAEIYSDNVPYWIRFLLTSPVQEKYLPARHVIIINNRKVDSFSSESCCDQHEVCDAPLPFLLVFFRLLLGKNNRELGSIYPKLCSVDLNDLSFLKQLLEASGLVDQCCRFLLRRMIIRAASILLDSGGVMEFGSSWNRRSKVLAYNVCSPLRRENICCDDDWTSESITSQWDAIVFCAWFGKLHLSISSASVCFGPIFWWASKETHGVVRLRTPVC